MKRNIKSTGRIKAGGANVKGFAKNLQKATFLEMLSILKLILLQLRTLSKTVQIGEKNPSRIIKNSKIYVHHTVF